MADPQDERRRRNNVRLAVAHALLAAGFLLAFVWVQIHQ